MNKMNPKVSMIIPAYNVEKYIAETLDSILSQTFGNYEVIIVNDGSTDNTPKVINRYLSDKRFKLIEIQNHGVSTARDKGFFEAKGEFVCFLDGDDQISKDFLLLMVKKIEKIGSDFCICDLIVKKNDKILRYIKYRYRSIKNSLLLSYLQTVVPLGVCTLLLRRDFLSRNNILYEPGCRLAEDVEFIIKVLLLGKGTFVAFPLFHWIRRENSAIVTCLKIHDIYDAFNRSKKFIEASSIDHKFAEECIKELMCRKLSAEFARVLFVGKVIKSEDVKPILEDPVFRKVIDSFIIRIDKRTIQFFVYMLGVYFPGLVRLTINWYHTFGKLLKVMQLVIFLS